MVNRYPCRRDSRLRLARKESPAEAQRPQRSETGRPAVHSAFTLIELLAVMAIMLVMLSISVMAFKDIGRGAGIRGATIQFKSATSLARQNAITRRQPTFLNYGNSASDGRAFYYTTESKSGPAGGTLQGATNYLPSGILFLDNDRKPIPGMPYVEFKLDGSLPSANTFGEDGGNNSRTIPIGETGTNANVNVLRIYKQTGRIKVIAESGKP